MKTVSVYLVVLMLLAIGARAQRTQDVCLAELEGLVGQLKQVEHFVIGAHVISGRYFNWAKYLEGDEYLVKDLIRMMKGIDRFVKCMKSEATYDGKLRVIQTCGKQPRKFSSTTLFSASFGKRHATIMFLIWYIP